MARPFRFVVDVWAQPPKGYTTDKLPEIKRLFEQSKSPLSKLAAAKAGPKDILRLMDASGVDKVFMSAWRRPGVELISNEDIYEYVKTDPQRYVGLGTVDLVKPMTAVRQVETCVKDYGFKGIRILPWLWDKPPTANYFYPVFSKCVELDVPFCTQVGHTGPLCPSEPGRPVPYIDQVALDFPELKIVCGHIGYPWTDEMIGVAWKHENVFIDTSAHAPKYYPPQLYQFMNTYGKDKVMFGTNFPMLQWEQCVNQAIDLPLKQDVMEMFMWKNANRVFKLGMDASDDEAKSKL